MLNVLLFALCEKEYFWFDFLWFHGLFTLSEASRHFGGKRTIRNFLKNSSSNILDHSSENIDENEEERDEHGHSSRDDLRRNEERRPRHHHKHARGQVVHREVLELVPGQLHGDAVRAKVSPLGHSDLKNYSNFNGYLSKFVDILNLGDVDSVHVDRIFENDIFGSLSVSVLNFS